MRVIALAALLLFLLPLPVLAGEAYAEVPLTKITGGPVPAYRPWVLSTTEARQTLMAPRVVLRGGGEAFVTEGQRSSLAGATVVVRVPAAGPVAGILLLPTPEFRGMKMYPFSVAAVEPVPGVAERFAAARTARYRRLLRSGVTGAAWFRHQLGADAQIDRRRPRRGNTGELEETFGMITGGRALSENLSLSEVMESVPTDEAATIPVDSIPGITVPNYDWTARLGDKKPALDRLSSLIPADQHALFFPSFTAMTDLLDEADAHGTPVLRWFETEAVDAGTRRRYEVQLALGMSELARKLGPHVVSSVAMTGADLSLRTGTDVAIIFEAKNVGLLEQMLIAQRRLIALPHGAQEGMVVGARIGGAPAHSFDNLDGDGTVESYQLRIGKNAVVVTNSIDQLRRILATVAGKAPSLASLDEYRFFRARYPKDEPETAFLMITDLTLRRWCGPRWRIGTSRRTRAAAVLAEYQARLAAGMTEPMKGMSLPGERWIRGDRAFSGTYGRFDALTPISALDLDRVTPAEKAGYERWRRGYETNWKQYYDPIAGRIHLDGSELSLDLSVLPLKTDSEYADLMEISGGSKIRPGSGDAHAAVLMHYILAIDRKSRAMKQIGGFTTGMTGDKRLSILDWIGETVSLRFEDGPFVTELLAAADAEEFMEENWGRIPVGVHVEIANPFKFVAFIAAARAFVAVSAPNMVTFVPGTYRDRQYMKISIREEEAEVFYTSWPGGFFITLSEPMLKGTIDRFVDREAMKKKDATGEAADVPPPLPWAGESVAFRGGGRMLAVIEKLGGPYFLRRMQDRSWSNLPILNEWRRLYPDQDPADVHERFFGIRPVCPGGQGYRFNAALGTYESPVFGRPGSPRGEAALPAALRRILSAELGITFEEGGVRGRAIIERK